MFAGLFSQPDPSRRWIRGMLRHRIRAHFNVGLPPFRITSWAIGLQGWIFKMHSHYEARNSLECLIQTEGRCLVRPWLGIGLLLFTNSFLKVSLFFVSNWRTFWTHELVTGVLLLNGAKQKCITYSAWTALWNWARVRWIQFSGMMLEYCFVVSDWSLVH